MKKLFLPGIGSRRCSGQTDDTTATLGDDGDITLTYDEHSNVN